MIQHITHRNCLIQNRTCHWESGLGPTASVSFFQRRWGMFISKIHKVNLGSWRRSIQPKASQTNLEHNVTMCIWVWIQIFHQPLNTWNKVPKGFSMLSLWSEVVWARYNLTKCIHRSNCCIVGWTMSMIDSNTSKSSYPPFWMHVSDVFIPFLLHPFVFSLGLG